MLRRFHRLRPRARRLIALTLTALALCARAAPASEVDDFTDRASLTEDAEPLMDGEVNKILERAVLEANKSSPDHCNKVMLRQEIVRWVGPDPIGLFEFWANFTADVARTHTGFDQSVYAGASFGDSPAMRIFGIGRSVRLSGHVVGTDKLGHFFMQGLDYFRRVQDGAELAAVMTRENGEDGLWGLKATGIKSYGDLSANFSGYLFWKDLYQGERPYARCPDGKKWVKARQFRWSEYVTDAWDEAINCSEMLPGLEQTFRKNLERLGLRCPIDPGRCFAISQLEMAKYTVSPVCLKLSDPQGASANASRRISSKGDATQR